MKFSLHALLGIMLATLSMGMTFAQSLVPQIDFEFSQSLPVDVTSTCPNCTSGTVVSDSYSMPLLSSMGSMLDGIDVDSLTPESQSKKLYKESKARLMFKLDTADVNIFLLGRLMPTPGVKRSFVIPIPKRDTVYKYEIRFDVIRDGKKYYKKFKLEDLQAGSIHALTVLAPTVEAVKAGEEITFVIAAELVQDGGKEGEKKEEGETEGGTSGDEDQVDDATDEPTDDTSDSSATED